MTLSFQVLGDPGRDNALLVKVDTGQAVSRLLLDCGEGCLSGLPFAEVREIDHLFFSHLHMDHVAGFDAFFRCTFDRTDRANHVWGRPARPRSCSTASGASSGTSWAAGKPPGRSTTFTPAGSRPTASSWPRRSLRPTTVKKGPGTAPSWKGRATR